MSDWMIIPSDEDIEHGFYKYIDKVRTATGKWRYIYERNNNLRRKVKFNKAMRERMKQSYINKENKVKSIQDNQSLKSNPFHGQKDTQETSQKMDKLDAELRKALNEKHATYETYKNYVHDIMATEKEYLNTPMGKAEASIPGLSKLLDFIDKKTRR